MLRQPRYTAITILVFGVAIFFLFFQLGKQSLLCSDESLYAVNALEMMETGNLITPTFLGEPDHYNCKPPVSVIASATSMSIFGKTEWAFRLPSALAALGTMILLFWFAVKWLKNPLIGFVAVLVLATSPGYVNNHIARTGDTDATLIFFITLYALAFYGYLYSDFQKSKNKYLLVMTVGIVLAFLTKGIVAFIPLPALLMFAFYLGEGKELLTTKRIWIAATVVITCCLSYLFIREANDPGYLKALYNLELGNRLTTTIGGHEQTFHYYAYNLLTDRFKPWIFLFIPAVIIGLLKADRELKKVLWFMLMLCTVIGLVFSLAQTKLYWYDGPLYPFMALALGIGLYAIYDQISHKLVWQRLIISLAFFTCLGYSGMKVYENITTPTYTSADKDGRLMLAFRAEKPGVKNYIYFKQTNRKPLLGVATFYAKAWQDTGYNINVKTAVKDCSNKVVLTPHWHVAKWLKEHYKTEKIFECELGVALKISDSH